MTMLIRTVPPITPNGNKLLAVMYRIGDVDTERAMRSACALFDVPVPGLEDWFPDGTHPVFGSRVAVISTEVA
jgi:hypothetical protein